MRRGGTVADLKIKCDGVGIVQASRAKLGKKKLTVSAALTDGCPKR